MSRRLVHGEVCFGVKWLIWLGACIDSRRSKALTKANLVIGFVSLVELQHGLGVKVSHHYHHINAYIVCTHYYSLTTFTFLYLLLGSLCLLGPDGPRGG